MKIVCRTKDDNDIIEDFIKYYSQIVPLKNIIIIDNGSHYSTWMIYKPFIDQGLIVEKSNSGHASQGNDISKIIERYKNEQVLVVDADEFIGYVPPKKNKMQIKDLLNPTKVKKEFDRLIGYPYIGIHKRNTHPPKNKHEYFNRPYTDCKNAFLSIRKCDSEDNCCAKKPDYFQTVCVNSNSFSHVIPGNHRAIFKVDYIYPYECNSLIVVHFHDTGYPMKISRAFRNSIGYNYISHDWKSSFESLKSKANTNIFGQHKVLSMIDFINDIGIEQIEEIWSKLFMLSTSDRAKLISNLYKPSTKNSKILL